MTTFNRNTTHIATLFIIFAILFGSAVAGIDAAENQIAPEPSPMYTQNCQTAGEILLNTPPYGRLESHWNEYIASLNWKDYDGDTTTSCASAIVRLLEDDAKAEQLLSNTPPYGRLESHWNEYIASLNWADYAEVDVGLEQWTVPYTCVDC